MASKIPLKAVFLNPEGKPLTKDNLPVAEDRSNVLTYKDALIIALTRDNDAEDRAKIQDPMTDILARHSTYEKLLNSGDATEMELTEDEVNRLKPRIAKHFNMLVAGPMLVQLNKFV